MLLPLTSVPALTQVDSDIFTLRYYARCMGCTFCHDSCCQYGCDVNLGERDKILALAPEISKVVKHPVATWFKPEVFEDAEYPTGKYVRANTADGACVFLNPDGRGCGLHRFAAETGRDYHDIKPMVCWLFPICWDKGVLRPNTDVKDDLACFGNGPTLYASSRDELKVVFGQKLISELDAYVPQFAPQPLPEPKAALQPR
jgi:Fe-S-cluster containining protein